MKDYAMFLKDLGDENEIVFTKGRVYEILDENKEHYFIQIKPRTNQVSQIPKSLAGELYTIL